MVHVSIRSSLISSVVIYIICSTQMGVTSGGHALHASSYQIQQLWENEERTVEIVHTLLKSLTRLTDVFNRYVASWSAISDGTQTDHGREDPAAIYTLLRHVAQGWREVDLVLSDTRAIFNQLAKLAHTYRFNSSSLAEGIIRSTAEVDGDCVDKQLNSVLHPLSVDELASIGVAAMNKGYFDVGVEFLKAASVRASSNPLWTLSGKQMQHLTTSSEYSTQHIESLLRTAVKVHNHVLEVRGPRSLTHTTSHVRFETTRLEIQLRKREKERQEKENVILSDQYLSRHDNKTWMLNHRALVELQQVERLCRGEDLREINVSSSLSCSYLNSRSPWLLLAPFKMEVVSLDPHIALLYDVVTPRESENIKAAARKSLQTPPPQQVTQKGRAPPEEWSLKHVWLESKSQESLQRLSRRLSHVTNLNIDDNTSEPFMVANYGIGGEYKAHRDTHGPTRTPPDEEIGERIATIVTYLEAPRAGGRLVFPWVGVSVQAINRAAVIWWNLLASHEHDFLTVHAACPILRGNKWIANKWVGYKAQWNTQTCPTDPSRKISLSR
ncbi:prolyl 4-hydroxylase subunit alpha-2-like [Macrobrachium nipponense]|uniref:prolyl 4-hydroxylase subunit alpha-2-like n=1 Tax=Macrobrachium nipponense TaxID=159736 RepID=UPI0030C822DE